MEEEGGRKKLALSPNPLRIRWAIILVLLVSLQVAFLLWEAADAPAHCEDALPQFPTVGWPGRALVKDVSALDSWTRAMEQVQPEAEPCPPPAASQHVYHFASTN